MAPTLLQGSTPSKTPSKRIQRNHPEDQIIGDINAGIEKRRKRKESITNQEHVSLISLFEPKNVEEAINDEHWVKAMKEELIQIEKNETWELVPRPINKNVIGAKWVFINKLDEEGNVNQNKSRLICKGYAQVEGIDYGETYAYVARMEEIRLILSYACSK